MNLKKIVRKLYILWLQRKWRMSPAGANLLGGGVRAGLQEA